MFVFPIRGRQRIKISISATITNNVGIKQVVDKYKVNAKKTKSVKDC